MRITILPEIDESLRCLQLFAARPACPCAAHAVLLVALGTWMLLISNAAGAAGPAQDSARIDLDLLTLRHAPVPIDSRRAPYSFAASLMLSQGSTPSLDALRDANNLRAGSIDDPKTRLLQTDPVGKPLIGDGPSLGARFRYESKGERFEIRPRRRSIWIQYSRDFN